MILKPRSAVSVLCLVAGLVLTPASPAPARPFLAAATARPVELPDTPAGRVAKGFLAMVSDGSEKAVADFEGRYASEKRRGQVTPAERATRIKGLHEQWGTATVDKILATTEQGLFLSITIKSGEALGLEFQLSDTESGKLDAVMISSGGPPIIPMPVSEGVIAESVEGAAKALEESYVYPEVAKKMGEAIRGKLKAGEYRGIKDDAALAKRLTDDLQAVSHDKHLRVRLAPKPSEAPTPHGDMGQDRREMERDNYAFRKAELLAGNVGYLRLDGFVEDEQANATASAALAFLSHADALIVDLRFNGGGSPEMIRYITSYLFDEPTHLNDMIDREGKVVEEYWTLKDVPGKRFPKDLPVYVLTSSRTFSGAEEFSYNLKNLKRATLVGETTGGGAHPVRGDRLSDRLMITVPFMRANNPISKTNWEGTGVEPDIKVPAAEALERATAEARKAIESRGSQAKK